MNSSANARNIILFGPPGVGKGAQAQIMSFRYELPHLSTGEVIRDEIARATPMGIEVREAVNRGQFADDATVLKIVMSRIDRPEYGNGFVMDGVPRTVGQAEMLDRLLSERGRRVSYALLIHAPEETILARLAGRRICSKCNRTYHKEFNRPKIHGICDEPCYGKVVRRHDDTPEAHRDRLRTYAEKTLPLEQYYSDAGVLVHIDGDQPVEAVAAEIRRAINGG